MENTNPQIAQNLLQEEKTLAPTRIPCTRMPSELAQQEAHEIPQLSVMLPPLAGTTRNAQMGPIILWEMCKSMVHTTRRTPQQSQNNVPMTSEQWLVGLITIIWSHVHEKWEACNNDCHFIDAAT